MPSAEQIIGALKGRGRRITPRRKAVIGAFAASREPISAAQVAASFKRKRIKADKTTIYREIEFLVAEGVLNQLHFDERSKRYELRTDEHKHHLICTGCSKVEDAVLNHDLDAVERSLTKQKKFKDQSHSLEFYGLCETCQN